MRYGRDLDGREVSGWTQGSSSSPRFEDSRNELRSPDRRAEATTVSNETELDVTFREFSFLFPRRLGMALH